MSALTLVNLTARTYTVDTVIEGLDSEIDGGNSDEQAHKGGDDPYYFHPVGHNVGAELHQGQNACLLRWRDAIRSFL